MYQELLLMEMYATLTRPYKDIQKENRIFNKLHWNNSRGLVSPFLAGG